MKTVSYKITKRKFHNNECFLYLNGLKSHFLDETAPTLRKFIWPS